MKVCFFCKKLPNCLPKCLCHIAFPPVVKASLQIFFLRSVVLSVVRPFLYSNVINVVVRERGEKLLSPTIDLSLLVSLCPSPLIFTRASQCPALRLR